MSFASTIKLNESISWDSRMSIIIIIKQCSRLIKQIYEVQCGETEITLHKTKLAIRIFTQKLQQLLRASSNILS